jgi:hypothetical protein
LDSFRPEMLISSVYNSIINNTHNLNPPIRLSCNWLGGNATVHAMDWYGKKEFAATLPKVMTINDAAVGQVKSLDNFSWA